MPIIGKLKPLKRQFHFPLGVKKPKEVMYSLLDGKQSGKTSEETRGERNGNSKLTEDDIRFIRKSKRTLRALSEQFFVSMSHIANIKAKRAWGHVD